jgi:hypothetical protein
LGRCVFVHVSFSAPIGSFAPLSVTLLVSVVSFAGAFSALLGPVAHFSAARLGSVVSVLVCPIALVSLLAFLVGRD